MSGELVELPSVEDDRPALRTNHPADAVEHAGFTRPVRADDRVDLSRFDLEAHPVQGGDAAKLQQDVVDHQLSHVSAASRVGAVLAELLQGREDAFRQQNHSRVASGWEGARWCAGRSSKRSTP